MRNYDLVIFFFYGVLVDSERITNTIFAEMLNEIGIPATLETMFDEFVGNSLAGCLELIEAKLKAPVPKGFVEEYRRRSKFALQRSLVAVDGIVDALDQITLPTCVASSGDHDKMRTTLGITGLLPRFEGRLFSVTEVERGKPHPDVFLHAAKTMRVIPERCAVVEDTVIGATAGVAAGMRVFGYAKHTKAARLKSVGAVPFEDMRELPLLVQGVG